MQTVKTVEVEQRGTYSIYYSHDDNPDQFALDWNFTVTDGMSQLQDTFERKRKEPPHWSATVKDYGGRQWYNHAEADEKMYEVLLAHFGLSEWRDEFTFEKMKFMSPRVLAEARRKKEEQGGLEKHEMKSSTAGFHIAAEKYCG